MADPLHSVAELVAALEAHHGTPEPLERRGALGWILWENAGYLIDDERRAVAYEALREATGLTAAGIRRLTKRQLRAIAEKGGMMPDGRVDKLRKIAALVEDEFDGDLEAVLDLPLAKARRALKRFPGIGDPGADKILLFTETHARPALESNGLRVLVRVGLVGEGKSYAATYRAAMEEMEADADRGCAWLIRAFQVLRRHGQAPCKNKDPHCDACPLADGCPRH